MAVPPIQKSNSATTSTGEVAANRTIQEVPKGVGAAPTTIQSAAEPAKELGYVESAVQWIAGLVSSIFTMICCCFFTDEEADAEEEKLPPLLVPPTEEPELASPSPTITEVPPPAAVVEEPSQPLATVVRDDIRAEVDLLDSFDELTENEKKVIYRKIGEKALRFYYPGQYRRSIEETGELEVKKNYRILKDYLNTKSN